jgi:hypothetical protein
MITSNYCRQFQYSEVWLYVELQCDEWATCFDTNFVHIQPIHIANQILDKTGLSAHDRKEKAVPYHCSSQL